jgi:hypothetical protein
LLLLLRFGIGRFARLACLGLGKFRFGARERKKEAVQDGGRRSGVGYDFKKSLLFL